MEDTMTSGRMLCPHTNWTLALDWLRQHCWEYGFILRYPKGKEHITGVIFEPWHFRFVGKEAAAYIYENDLTLEEFLIFN